MGKKPAAARGATRVADVPGGVLAELNAGRAQTRTLAEMLAMDLRVLLRVVVGGVTEQELEGVAAPAGITRRMQHAGGVVLARCGLGGTGRLASHPSDTVRGWAAYAVALAPGLSLAERVARVRPLADDPHSGVREWAWLALRPRVAEGLDEAIALLTPWTSEATPNLRRFASEITRPRGVWCRHLEALKADPSAALCILERLRDDPSRYVQDSVANWLNDASKSTPGWVRGVCERWGRSSGSARTARIIRRGLRTMGAV
jgi:3-methyladenine DNA glycosylase AlkC